MNTTLTITTTAIELAQNLANHTKDLLETGEFDLAATTVDKVVKVAAGNEQAIRDLFINGFTPIVCLERVFKLMEQAESDGIMLEIKVCRGGNLQSITIYNEQITW
jgi:hypothetical protein